MSTHSMRASGDTVNLAADATDTQIDGCLTDMIDAIGARYVGAILEADERYCDNEDEPAGYQVLIRDYMLASAYALNDLFALQSALVSREEFRAYRDLIEYVWGN